MYLQKNEVKSIIVHVSLPLNIRKKLLDIG